VNGQGGIDEGLIDGVDETIDSKTNIAKACAGGWCTCKAKAAERHHVNHRSLRSRTRTGEAPECEPVPLHRASRHVGTDVNTAEILIIVRWSGEELVL
jgi:hypothetical protein